MAITEITAENFEASYRLARTTNKGALWDKIKAEYKVAAENIDTDVAINKLTLTPEERDAQIWGAVHDKVLGDLTNSYQTQVSKTDNSALLTNGFALYGALSTFSAPDGGIMKGFTAMQSGGYALVAELKETFKDFLSPDNKTADGKTKEGFLAIWKKHAVQTNLNTWLDKELGIQDPTAQKLFLADLEKAPSLLKMAEQAEAQKVADEKKAEQQGNGEQKSGSTVVSQGNGEQQSPPTKGKEPQEIGTQLSRELSGFNAAAENLIGGGVRDTLHVSDPAAEKFSQKNLPLTLANSNSKIIPRGGHSH